MTGQRDVAKGNALAKLTPCIDTAFVINSHL